MAAGVSGAWSVSSSVRARFAWHDSDLAGANDLLREETHDREREHTRPGGGARGHASLKLGPRHRASVSARTVKLTLTPALSAASLVWLRRHRQARPRPSPPRRAVARSGTPPRVWPLRTHAGVSSESLTRRHAGMLKKLD